MKKSTIQKLAKEIHQTAVEKGWWDNDRNVNEIFMLIVTEIAEAVEADRNDKTADIVKFEKYLSTYQGKDIDEEVAFKNCFKKYIKDSVEDELADAFIRCLDYLYYRDSEVEINFMDVHWNKNFAENLFFITKVVTSEDIRTTCGAIHSFCARHGIDLRWHVRAKMRYNGMRSKKHGGKKY